MINMSSGNTTVDKIGEMHLTGNVVPSIWCKRICYKNGKPNLNAILILSDIVYWYRPTERRDEATGQVLRHDKKFSADLLQRNYKDFAEQFGLSRKQVKESLDLLEELGIIYRELRNLTLKSQTINNVLYIGLNADRLRQITFDEDDTLYTSADGVPDIEADTSVPESEEGSDAEVMSLPTQKYIAPSPEDRTNTNIISKTSDRDYYNHIIQSGPEPQVESAYCDVIDGIDKAAAYRKIIRNNIDFDTIIQGYKHTSDRKRYEELYEIICDVVCTDSPTIRIAGQEKPASVVRSRFLKLNYMHLQYVMDCIDKTTKKINNIHAYLVTSLYRALETMENCTSQQVTHDMYEAAIREREVATA